MSLTGRFDPDFNKATDLPSADLPREEPEDDEQEDPEE